MTSRAARWATSFAAAVVEAWHELRMHKLRVLLSLVGVMVAVASLTGAVAAGSIARQAAVEQYEHDGRPAFLNIWAYNPFTGSPATGRLRTAVAAVADEFDIDWVTMRGRAADMEIANGPARLTVFPEIVDPAFATMHRIVPYAGRWLQSGDERNLSPAVVISDQLLDKLGLGDQPLPLTLDLVGDRPVTVTVIGTVRNRYSGKEAVYLLPGTYDHWFAEDRPMEDAGFEMWVPTEDWKALAASVRQAVSAELPGFQVDVDRNDYLAYGEDDPLREVSIVVSVIAGVILLLGVLSLLNVALVTIQQRVREVGIRRSFGATTGRVFFSVLMESVVATAVAGGIGVLLAVAALTNPWVADRFLDGIDDVPPFPVDAALLGLAVSVGVGVLAGVLPALVASRVKIIDAIRF